jgi:TonB family protein
MRQHSAHDGQPVAFRPRTPRAALAFGIGLTVFIFFAAHTGQAQSASEYQVKAAYLYNFAKSTEWPEQSLPVGSSPVVIGVFSGDEEFVDALQQIVAGKTVGTHAIMVKRVASETEVEFCQLVFFRSSAGHKRTQGLISSLAGANVLLVGEDDAFLAEGGMINLVLKNGTIRFEINTVSLERANIRLSAALLTAANADRGSSSHPTAEARQLKVSVPPLYPEIAKRMNIKGVVQLEVLVGRDGSVKEVIVVGGHPLLTEAAVKAVKQWQYEPAAKESREIVKLTLDH